MQAIERSALLIGDEPSRLERFVSPLRRADLAVVRAEHVWDAERSIRDDAHGLIVVALPVLGAERFVQGVRAPTSASRSAGLIVVGAGDDLEPNDLIVGNYANRLLPGGCSVVDFQQAANDLLDVAPRISVEDEVRLQVTLPNGQQLELWLENLSTSGMLMRTLETLSVGTVFGFALEIASEGEPIRGRGKVVRSAGQNPFGHWGLGARFLALGGEAPQRLTALVERTAASGPAPATAAPHAANQAVAIPSQPARVGARTESVGKEAEDQWREALNDLTPVLDEALERGLVRRLTVADWYVTGAELGLESLRAFSEILSAIYEDRSISDAAQRRLADLFEVRKELVEFGRPEQDVSTRVRILLELRPALHRLLRELDESAEPSEATAAPSPGAVSQAVVEIQRLVGARRALDRLAALLERLRRPVLLPMSGVPRRTPQQICEEFGALARGLGVSLSADQLASRRGLLATLQGVELEADNLARRLAAIHRRAYSGRFRDKATDDVEADLQHTRLRAVLVETLAAGAEYLARSYSAYRHALESVDGSPALLERAERLAGSILDADRSARLATSIPV